MRETPSPTDKTGMPNSPKLLYQPERRQAISVPGAGYSRTIGVYLVGEVSVLDVPVGLAQHRRLDKVDGPRRRALVQVLVVLVDLLPGLRRLLEPQARALCREKVAVREARRRAPQRRRAERAETRVAARRHLRHLRPRGWRVHALAAANVHDGEAGARVREAVEHV